MNQDKRHRKAMIENIKGRVYMCEAILKAQKGFINQMKDQIKRLEKDVK